MNEVAKMAQYAGPSSPEPSAREGSVLHSLQAQIVAIEALAAVIQHIEQLAQPVLVPGGATEASKSEQPPQPTRCTVAKKICDHSAIITAQADRLRELSLRLGLN